MDELALKQNNILQLKANVAALTAEYTQLEREIADSARGVRELEVGQEPEPLLRQGGHCVRRLACCFGPAPRWLYLLLAFNLACISGTAFVGMIVSIAADRYGSPLLGTALFITAIMTGALVPCVLMTARNI